MCPVTSWNGPTSSLQFWNRRLFTIPAWFCVLYHHGTVIHPAYNSGTVFYLPSQHGSVSCTIMERSNIQPIILESSSIYHSSIAVCPVPSWNGPVSCLFNIMERTSVFLSTIIEWCSILYHHGTVLSSLKLWIYHPSTNPEWFCILYFCSL